MWGKLCHGAAGISGFPIWVQLLGHLFFDTIDRDGKYRVSQQVLDENFVSIKFREIKFWIKIFGLKIPSNWNEICTAKL